MGKRETFFGSLEPLLSRDGKVVTELAIFHSNGKSHKHDQWEICYVLSGEGHIFTQNKAENFAASTPVEKGVIVKIPPNRGHWMEVDEGKEMEILLVYSDNA